MPFLTGTKMYRADDWLTIQDTDDSHVIVTVPVQLVRTLLAGKGLCVITRQEYDILQQLLTAMRAGGMSKI